MKSIDFQFLLTNAAFPATVLLTSSSLLIEFKDVPCEFSLIENFSQVSSYKSQSGSRSHSQNIDFEYSKHDQKLCLHFLLKEFCTQGKSQVHELPSSIEKFINSMMLHAKVISSVIEPVVLNLANSHGIRLKTLTHHTCVVIIESKSFGEIEIKTFAKNSNSVCFQSSLLTTRLFEHYFDLNKPISLSETFEQLVISTEFQLILNESLKTLSSQSIRAYQDYSYSFSGLTCIANSFNEVHICYMKEIIVKVRVRSYHYTLDVLDMFHFNNSLMQIRRFEGCLHHCVSKALKDPSLAGIKNTVDTRKEAGLFQTLELHKPQHVKNALIMIINYIQLTYLFEKSRIVLSDHARSLQYLIKGSFLTYSMLDLRADFSLLSELNFALVFKMKPSDMGLDVDIEIETKPSKESEQEKLENWKKVLMEYFNRCVKEYSRGYPEIVLGFIKIFLIKTKLLGNFIEILEEEIRCKDRIEFVWPLFTLKHDNYTFTVRVWDMQNRPSDITFSIKHSLNDSPQILTNFDSTILASHNYSSNRCVDVVKLALSKRADEMKFIRINEN